MKQDFEIAPNLSVFQGLDMCNLGVFRPILEFKVSKWGFLGTRNRLEWSKILKSYHSSPKNATVGQKFQNLGKNVPTLTLNIFGQSRAISKLYLPFWMTILLKNQPKKTRPNWPKNGRKKAETHKKLGLKMQNLEKRINFELEYIRL